MGRSLLSTRPSSTAKARAALSIRLPQFHRSIGIKVQVGRMAVEAPGEGERSAPLQNQAQVLDACQDLPHQALVKLPMRSQS